MGAATKKDELKIYNEELRHFIEGKGVKATKYMDNIGMTDKMKNWHRPSLNATTEDRKVNPMKGKGL